MRLVANATNLSYPYLCYHLAAMAVNPPLSAADASPDATKVALEELVYDNPELERLEAILETFNPFVALQWTRQELRHSAFLAWLLNPTGTHGLGDYFLSIWLKRIARRSPIGGPSVVEIDAWDLSQAVVQQEWRNIDLLIQDDANHFVVAIENKIDSTEHSDQLRRYQSEVELHFPRHRALFAYLTPGGEPPSNEVFAAIGYTEVVSIVEDTLQRRGEQLADDVRTFLHQYAEMLRRYIVEDSEIQQLCRTIYAKHKKALDVIFEQRPDRAADVAGILRGVVSRRSDLIPDHGSKAYIRFIPKKWDFLPYVGDGWTPSKRMVLFELYNGGDQVRIGIILGPGDPAVRNRVHQKIREHPEVFNRAGQRLYPQWWSFHTEKWITKKTYTEATFEELEAAFEQRLDRFLAEQLPAMETVFMTLQEASARE